MIALTQLLRSAQKICMKTDPTTLQQGDGCNRISSESRGFRHWPTLGSAPREVQKGGSPFARESEGCPLERFLLPPLPGQEEGVRG